ADLSVFHGIAGILSSEGNFAGPLDDIQVKGETTTPDFSVSISGHQVQLKTEFQASVDGSNGDTLLHPVVARFLHSTVVASGGVVKLPSGRREIKLHLTTNDARLEDVVGVNRRGAGDVFVPRAEMAGSADVAGRSRIS